MRRTVYALLLIAWAAVAAAETSDPLVRVAPTGDGFDSYLTAAMVKKHVPVRIVEPSQPAALTLKATPLAARRDSASTKVLKCVFNSCGGIGGDTSVSVQLVDRQGAIVWSYAVNRDRGDDDPKSMAEDIAKRLKKEYFRR